MAPEPLIPFVLKVARMIEASTLETDGPLMARFNACDYLFAMLRSQLDLIR